MNKERVGIEPRFAELPMGLGNLLSRVDQGLEESGVKVVRRNEFVDGTGLHKLLGLDRRDVESLLREANSKGIIQSILANSVSGKKDVVAFEREDILVFSALAWQIMQHAPEKTGRGREAPRVDDLWEQVVAETREVLHDNPLARRIHDVTSISEIDQKQEVILFPGVGENEFLKQYNLEAIENRELRDCLRQAGERLSHRPRPHEPVALSNATAFSILRLHDVVEIRDKDFTKLFYKARALGIIHPVIITSEITGTRGFAFPPEVLLAFSALAWEVAQQLTVKIVRGKKGFNVEEVEWEAVILATREALQDSPLVLQIYDINPPKLDKYERMRTSEVPWEMFNPKSFR